MSELENEYLPSPIKKQKVNKTSEDQLASSSNTDDKYPMVSKQTEYGFLLFCSKKKETFIDENPGLSNSKIIEKMRETYNNLSEEKKEKWQRRAAKTSVKHEEVEQLCIEHSDEITVKYENLETKDLQKQRTPFEIYVERRQKDNTSKEILRLKKNWNTMSNEKKAKWIKRALLEQHTYENKWKEYALKHPEHNMLKFTSLISIEEMKILEEVYGRQTKEPESAYQLFNKSLMQHSEEQEQEEDHNKTYYTDKWKRLPEGERNEYKKQHQRLLGKYEAHCYKNYPDSLPDEQMILEEAPLQNKKKKCEIFKNETHLDTLNEIFKQEPSLPPSDGKSLFATEYEGDEALDIAWNSLSCKRQNKYERRAEALKYAHLAEYENFLNSLTVDQLRSYANYKSVEEIN